MNTIAEDYEEDRLLVTTILRGDHGLFAKIIRRSESMVTNILCNMIRIEEDRKDIAQEVYLKAFKNLSGFKHQSKLTTWICQIAYNTCLNHLAKKKFILLDDFNRSQESDLVLKQDIEWQSSSVPPAVSNMFSQDLSTILSREIKRLQPLYQTLIGLYHQEDLSYAEIGQITQLPEGTVKSYLYRARKALRENILINYKPDDL